VIALVGADARNPVLAPAKIRNLVPASTSVPAAASHAPDHRKGNPPLPTDSLDGG
jgi:hypothetical protein